MNDISLPNTRPTRWWIYTVLAALFVFALRVHWVDMTVSRFPYWDEIPAELMAEARRATGESPSLGDLIRPHNEHRILWQRLIAHGLVAGNDSFWDSRVRAMANAVFAALYAALLANALRGGFHGRIGHLLFWPAVALVASPIAYQNMIFAFQTSFHLQMLFSIAAFIGLGAGSPRRPIWWAGLTAALAAIFTNGSGFFTGPVLLVWILFSIARRENGSWFPEWKSRVRSHLPNLLASILILALGLALIHRPENAVGQQASSIGEFFHGLAKHLAWPWQDKPWLAPLTWCPFATLALLVLLGRGRGAWLQSARFAICLGGWLLLNFLAMAYARGALAVGPVPRYEDFHLLGTAVNAASLVLVATESSVSKSRLQRMLPTGLGLLWAPTVLSGLFVLLTWALRIELPDYHAFGRLQEKNAARFTHDGDTSVFDGYVSRFHLPYDEPEKLRTWLSDPAALALLPPNFHSSAEAVQSATREGTCVDSRLPEGVAIPPGERLLGSSFSRDPVAAARDASVTSGPIQAPSGAIRLFYLGMDTGGALKLRLKPEGGGKAISIPSDRRHGTATWMPITINVDPRKSYRLEFRDGSRVGWGAVTLPTNEPPLSRLADQLGRLALPTALLILLAIFATAAWPRTPTPAPEPREVTP